jgi:hypothetical protein
MEERSYRQSRLCRVFGNPVAFTIAQLLLENGESDHFVKLKILTRRDLHLRKAGRPLKVAS